MKKILLLTIGVIFTVAILLADGRRYGIPRVADAEENLALGEKVYGENCAACHGPKGDGKGPEASRLKTKPRDFMTGNYKFRSTPSGSLPLDQDIFQTISRGVRSTSMLAQLHLSEKERWAVTEYLKTFSNRFKTEKPLDPSATPAVPSPSRDLITLGKTMYTDAGCNQCHGAEGKGNGPSTNELKDELGNPIVPTDLTLKPFKSGPGPEDLYRTLSTGLNGTPMPSYADALTPKERWALVFYILSIATQERPRGMMGLVGEEVEGMRVDMRAAMAGMMGDRGMMGRGGGMMNRDMNEMMKDMMGR
jgi:cytochrome c oxidase cbb3-type subunit 2